MILVQASRTMVYFGARADVDVAWLEKIAKGLLGCR
jgi:hypothetical protein